MWRGEIKALVKGFLCVYLRGSFTTLMMEGCATLFSVPTILVFALSVVVAAPNP